MGDLDSDRPDHAAVLPPLRLTVPDHYDFGRTLGQLARGRHDPCARFVDGAFWLAVRTPDGPGTLTLTRAGGQVEAQAYGPGAGWLLDRAAAVAGLRDDLTGFGELAASHP